MIVPVIQKGGSRVQPQQTTYSGRNIVPVIYPGKKSTKPVVSPKVTTKTSQGKIGGFTNILDWNKQRNIEISNLGARDRLSNAYLSGQKRGLARPIIKYVQNPSKLLDDIRGVKKQVQEIDPKRVKTALKSGVKSIPGTLKISGGVIADSWAKQQKAVNSFMVNPLVSSPFAKPLIKPVEKTGVKLRETGQKEREKATEPYTKLGESSNKAQKIAEAIVFNLPQMAITTGLTIGTGIVTKNPMLAATVGLSTSYGLGASEVYSEARSSGLSDKDAQPLAMTGGALIGALDFLPLTRLVNKIGGAEAVKRSIVKKIANGIVSTGTQSGFEGITEGAQEIIGNAIASTYNENKELFENVGLATVVGAIFGGAVDVSLNAVMFATNRTKPEDIEKNLESILEKPESSRTFEEQQVVEQMLTTQLTPDEAITTVINQGIEKTSEGKEITKVALQARNEGKEVRISTSEDREIGNVEIVDPKDLSTTQVVGSNLYDESDISPAGRIKTASIDKVFSRIPDGTTESKGLVMKKGDKLYPTSKYTPEMIKNDGIVLNSDGSLDEGFLMNRIAFTEDVVFKTKTTATEKSTQENRLTSEEIKESAKIIYPPETHKSDLEKINFDFIQKNIESIVNKYIKKYPNELNSDLVLPFLKGYNGINEDELRRPAASVRNVLFDLMLRKNKGEKNNTLLFVTAGQASGKSSTMEFSGLDKKDYPIVFETVWTDNATTEKLERALKEGYNIELVYILRPPLDAWKMGVLPRIRKEKRIVTEKNFITGHKEARERVLKFYDKHENNPNVSFLFTTNSSISVPSKTNVARVRKFQYNETDLIKEIQNATDEAYRNREITKTELQRIRGLSETSSVGVKKEVLRVSARTEEVATTQSDKSTKIIPKKTKSVPREQLPVGEGKEKVSRLEARIKKALEKVDQESIDKLGLTTYQELTKSENIAKAAEYVTNSPEDALRVLSGEIEAPKGILRNSIFVAMQNMAAGDVNLARKMASLEATRLGQEISILTEVDPDSPVTIIQEIIKIREKVAQARYKNASINKLQKDTVKKISEAVKKPDRNDWGVFIKSLEC